MPMNRGFVDMLRCPIAGSPLGRMSRVQLARLNELIAGGAVRTAAGGTVEKHLDDALLTRDGSWAYRVDSGVPTLLPELAIRIDRPAGGGAAAAYRRAAGASTDARWAALALAWPAFRPPMRPGRDDVAALETLVAECGCAAGVSSPRALLLGVTPEIATMRWPAGTSVLALDFSEAMIGSVWRAPERIPAAVVRGDWTAMPLRDGVFDVVSGDGNLTSLSYPGEYAAFAEETRRVLRATGALVLRLFARPERPDPLDTVFANLRAGRIREPAMLPWRIAMALHGTLAEGVRAGAVWEAWCERVPRPAELLAALGWPPQALRSLEWTRGEEYVMRFPTEGEVEDLLVRGFEKTARRAPGYDSGELYPTVVFRPGRRSQRSARGSVPKRGR
jgi:SAM-dependent methyltransferase